MYPGGLSYADCKAGYNEDGPHGTNVRTALESMISKGLIRKLEGVGKYLLTGLGLEVLQRSEGTADVDQHSSGWGA